MALCFLIYSVFVHSHHACIYGNQNKKRNGNATRREICRKLTFTRFLKSKVGEVVSKQHMTGISVKIRVERNRLVRLNFNTARVRQNARPINNNS